MVQLVDATGLNPVQCGFESLQRHIDADVAELVDAPDLGSGTYKSVEVRILSSANIARGYNQI